MTKLTCECGYTYELLSNYEALLMTPLVYISRGSANETIDWYEKLIRLGYIDTTIFEKREQMCQEIRAMLSKMIGSL